MAEKNYEPIITSFSITVEIPTDKPIVIFSCKDIYSWENTFLVKRNNSKILSEKKTFDTCRATLKWAATCGATLEKLENATKTIKFTFQFVDLENMLNFKTYLRSNVKDSVFF